MCAIEDLPIGVTDVEAMVNSFPDAVAVILPLELIVTGSKTSPAEKA